jgi:hypothetical protein
MFERFTDRARRLIVLAQEDARRRGHDYIGTEHILLGLLHEGEGVAARALGNLGIELPTVRAQVEEIIGRGTATPSGHIPFTSRAKKVLELSLREALDRGHNYIGTEHILLGLIREGEGVAAVVLVKLGAQLDRVRQQVLQLLATGPGVAEAATHRSRSGRATTVFVLHGPAGAAGRTDEVVRLIETLTDRPPVVLGDRPDGGRSVVAAFDEHGHAAVAVIVLGSGDGDGDDLEPDVAYRMGWLHGRLGRRGVVVLVEAGIEAPGHLGPPLITFDEAGTWRARFGAALQVAGVDVVLDPPAAPDEADEAG